MQVARSAISRPMHSNDDYLIQVSCSSDISGRFCDYHCRKLDLAVHNVATFPRDDLRLSGNHIGKWHHRTSQSPRIKSMVLSGSPSPPRRTMTSCAPAPRLPNLDCQLYAFWFRTKLREIGEKHKIDFSGFTIVDSKDANESAHLAAEAADKGKADLIQKGFLSTSALLKTVLSSDFSLRTQNTESCRGLGIPRLSQAARPYRWRYGGQTDL